eukprot:12202293-Karenia_brevis.AAC.1
MKSADRQIAIEDEHTRFSVIAVWHIHKQRWQFAELSALAFGLFNSVMHFNRVPTQLVALSRQLCALLGWHLDPEKSQEPSQFTRFLGVNEDISQARCASLVVLSPLPERVDSIL